MLIVLCHVVTPGITALEYAQRRSRLAANLPKDAIAIVAASDIKYRSGAVFYDFHQDSNFFYLTGMSHDAGVKFVVELSQDSMSLMLLL